jgi:hypothetical protein
MSRSEFNHILSSIGTLSPGQMRQLIRELERKMAATAGKHSARAKSDATRREPEVTAFDVADRAGLIGCIKGAPRSPTDLSTNPKHMEGFGRD